MFAPDRIQGCWSAFDQRRRTADVSRAYAVARPSRGLTIALWIAQLLLFGGFGSAGLMKSTMPLDQLAAMMPWAGDVPGRLVRFIGLSELAGAIGVLLPAMTRIRPGLTPLAAWPADHHGARVDVPPVTRRSGRPPFNARARRPGRLRGLGAVEEGADCTARLSRARAPGFGLSALGYGMSGRRQPAGKATAAPFNPSRFLAGRPKPEAEARSRTPRRRAIRRSGARARWNCSSASLACDDHRQALLDHLQLRSGDGEIGVGVVGAGVDPVADAAEAGGGACPS